MSVRACCLLAAFGFIDGRWVLHDVGHVRDKGELLTRANWDAASVAAPEALEVADGEREELVADASLDMFLLGLILMQVSSSHTLPLLPLLLPRLLPHETPSHRGEDAAMMPPPRPACALSKLL